MKMFKVCRTVSFFVALMLLGSAIGCSDSTQAIAHLEDGIDSQPKSIEATIPPATSGGIDSQPEAVQGSLVAGAGQIRVDILAGQIDPTRSCTKLRAGAYILDRVDDSHWSFVGPVDPAGGRFTLDLRVTDPIGVYTINLVYSYVPRRLPPPPRATNPLTPTPSTEPIHVPPTFARFVKAVGSSEPDCGSWSSFGLVQNCYAGCFGGALAEITSL